jgi:hypothetical protein
LLDEIKKGENKQLKIMNYCPKHQLTPPTEANSKNVRWRKRISKYFFIATSFSGERSSNKNAEAERRIIEG